MNIDWRAMLPGDLREALREIALTPPTTTDESGSARERFWCADCGAERRFSGDKSEVEHKPTCAYGIIIRYFPPV